LVAAKTSHLLRTFTPGPVFNARNELVGLALTAWYTRSSGESDWSAVEYVIQPWSEIANCIRVQLAPFLRKPDAPPPRPAADEPPVSLAP